MRRKRYDQDPLPFESCRDHCDAWTASNLGIDGTILCEGRCFNSSRADYRVRLIEVGTFELADFSNEVPIPELPPIINSVQFDRADMPDIGELGRFVATKFWRVGGLGKGESALVSEFRRKSSVPLFQTLLVHGEGKDSKQERLWQAARRNGYFEALRGLNDAVFVAPNFSVYTDRTQCQFHQRYNLARSIRFGSMLNHMGFPVVQSIACAGKRDQERIADWVIRQGDKVTHLAVNGQMRGASLKQNLADVAAIEALSGRAMNWVFFGPCRAQQFAEVFKTVQPSRATFVTGTVFQKLGAKEDLFGQKQASTSVNDLLQLLVSQLQSEYEAGLQGQAIRRGGRR